MTKQQIWLPSSLLPEDLAKVAVLSYEEITEALRKGREARIEVERYSSGQLVRS